MEKLFQENPLVLIMGTVVLLTLGFWIDQWIKYIRLRKRIEKTPLSQINIYELSSVAKGFATTFVANKIAEILSIRVLDMFYFTTPPSVIDKTFRNMEINKITRSTLTSKRISEKLREILIKEMSNRQNQQFLDNYKNNIIKKGFGSELELRELNGFAFLRKVKNKSNIQETPYIF